MKEGNRIARAVYFVAPGRVEVREEVIENESRNGKVLFHSSLIGISHGTEMLLFNGDLPQDTVADETIEALSGSLSYPIKYGYVNAGRTENGMKAFAFYPHQDLFYISQSDLVEIPEALSFEDAIFLANMETALGITHDAGLRFGEDVLVIGQGIVGLLTASILVRSGAGKVITVEKLEPRVELSRQEGFIALNPQQVDVREAVHELTGGRGVDAAIHTTSSSAGLQLAIDCTAFEGTVIEASWYGGKTTEVRLGEAFHRKRLTIRSSQVSTIHPALSRRWNKKRRFDRVIELLEAVKPSRFITHRFPLHDAQRAFERIRDNPGETVQVVLEP
ncbi:MAG: zinc-binding alcohol dehydrogenase [Spirochaetales bacterium]